MKNTRIKDLDTLIKKSIWYHGEVFNYDKTIYLDSYTPFTVTCKVCGDFDHTVRSHFKSAPGCPKCKRKSAYEKYENRFTIEDFLEKATKAHGDKFNYSLVVYKNSFTPITIICPNHGESQIEPRHHYKGDGCYKCGRESFSQKQRKYKSLDQLLADFKKVHSVRFNYDDVLFPEDGLTLENQVSIVCEHHGQFNQSVASHLNGNGCNKCRYFGYTKEAYLDYCKTFKRDFSTLYLLKLYDKKEEFYKIGITAQTIKDRYRKKKDKAGYQYEVMFSTDLPPTTTWDEETKIKMDYIKHSYKPNRWFAGHTECFNLSLPIQEIITHLKTLT